tara:strand:+ start:14310 stop:14849 length:540 start_codon:yes stop_codon:yes gene_type:complete
MDNEFFEEVDEDVEFSDEDFISEEELEDEVGEKGEAFVFPFSSVYITKLPDKFNPMKIFKEKEIILYNPNEKITPYNRIIPQALTIDLLKDSFIVSSIRPEQNNSAQSFSHFSELLNKGFKPIIDTYIAYEQSKETPEDNSPKNGNSNTFKPKPNKPQGTSNRNYGRKKKNSYNGKKRK